MVNYLTNDLNYRKITRKITFATTWRGSTPTAPERTGRSSRSPCPDPPTSGTSPSTDFFTSRRKHTCGSLTRGTSTSLIDKKLFILINFNTLLKIDQTYLAKIFHCSFVFLFSSKYLNYNNNKYWWVIFLLKYPQLK